MADRHKPETGSTRRTRLSDHMASLALPLAVIAFGAALSAGSDGVRAFVDLCRTALP
ncbi:hypothetical protein ANOBCDAF_03165 [Pleomorphomonas sp. T1.2MG-36]|uniref:hypothetical protein n=1 Tax=Pleomorphomonas sp. T1.2MG-36 TaxID=3041167 RepID=UPI002477A95E|nr:hypothetical protein [Pleomorphomonas sp. T1.2MG-36]CAI9414290.1 hypothetical protein ANOBCDAF_03165 [Pleomorphomonas sp. T1.2MG-36]